MLMDTLADAQQDIENRSTAEGYARFLKEQQSAKDNEGAYATYEAMKVIQGSIPLVAEEISKWLSSANKKGKGRTHTAYATLSTFDSDLLAYIGLVCVFTGLNKHLTAASVQVHVGTILEAEVTARQLEEERGEATAKRIAKVLSKQGGSRNRAKVFQRLSRKGLSEDQPKGWPQDFKIRLGEPIINAVLLALSDVFELSSEMVGKNNREVRIILTDAGVELLSQLRETVAWMRPIHKPMVVIPRRWETMDTGCYYNERASHNVKLVRTYSGLQRRMIREALANGSMDFVLEAINTAQETSWAINKLVLEVAEWAWENDISIPGFPKRQTIPMPQRLPKDAWEAMSDFDRKGYKRNLSSIREKNRSIVSDTAVILRDLETAKELSKYERFYLPHNMDFRGRVYPVPHFSHHRPDHIKALFTFADECPLGPYGAGWLSVHLANTGDFERMSKRSFDDRIGWVSDNEPLILRVGEDPRGTVDEWSKADSPFMFLAACLDYTGWVHGGRSDMYLSRLPVALDGSNSGLQHYSAALRSREEAALVSLTPCDEPADLYQTVADVVRASCEDDRANDSSMAVVALRGGVSRSLVKRNVMTFAYSSEQYGFRQQLLEDTMRPINDLVLMGAEDTNPYSIEREDGGDDGGFAASGYLAKKIWQAVTAVVTKATEGMAFFRNVAAVLAHEGKPLTWVSPVGLPVVHQYSLWDVKRVQLFLYDRAVPVLESKVGDKVDPEGRGVLKRISANIRTKPTTRIDKEKAKSAVAPNVIHSMDGAHLMLTVLGSKDAGITSLCLIHDSFGTHAGRTAEFSRIIREAFVGMYEEYDPFEEVLASARASLSEKMQARLPELPSRGDMDLREVLEADYAFA